MRILFVIKALSLTAGGAERVLRDIVGELARRGHTVTVASYDPPGSADFYPFDPAVERLRMGIGGVRERTRPAESLRRARALRTLARERRADVAIGFMASSFLPLGLALLGTGVPVIASEHITRHFYANNPLQLALLQLTPLVTHTATTVTESARQSFRGAFLRHLEVVPNPVASPAAEDRADPHGGALKTVLSVGRLEPQKNHAGLIAAFAAIAGRHPQWRLRIVGEGVLRPALEQQVAATGLGERIELPGATADVAREYRAAQLFVIASTFESFGLVTAEALLGGLPAIGLATTPGTNELIKPGINGLLVDGPDTTAALAEGMDRLMGDDDLRVRLGEQAPASASAYTLEAAADAWEALIRRAAARVRKG